MVTTYLSQEQGLEDRNQSAWGLGLLKASQKPIGFILMEVVANPRHNLDTCTHLVILNIETHKAIAAEFNNNAIC